MAELDSTEILGYLNVRGPIYKNGSEIIGYAGSMGYTGSRGATGYTGSQGATGFTGSQGTTGFTGSQGSIGYTGSRGATGYTGSQGTTGFTGSQGTTGFTGSQGAIGYTGSQGNVAGLKYTFSTTVTDADPGNGYLRFNSATLASVTMIYIDDVDRLGISAAAYIDTWDDSTSTVKGYLAIDSHANSDTSFTLFAVNSLTVATGYRKLSVSYITGSAFSNAELVGIRFYRTGDKGANGNNGGIGYTGSRGATGYTGSKGIAGNVGTFTVSTTAPASPVANDIWIDIS